VDVDSAATNYTVVVKIPGGLAANCKKAQDRATWLERLPHLLERMAREWSITIGEPFDSEVAWVAPTILVNGTTAILKLGMPHLEGQHEIRGMVFWNGEPTAQVFKADEQLNAMLLELCEPGTSLQIEPEERQDIVIADLLRRLWRSPSAPTLFRPLSIVTRNWAEETLADIASWPDAGLIREGLRLFEELPRTTSDEVLLATDVHAGNVLRAARKPWLVIDPKPFVGDPAYDVTQHLLNCPERMQSDCNGMIHRLADLTEVDEERIRLWMFARIAAEPRDDWDNSRPQTLARELSI
jgi:streptomycin 6-kinase